MSLDVFNDEITRARIKAIIGHYGHTWFNGKSVLDLGCGDGSVGIALARLGATVVAIDARQEHLDIINDKHPHIKTIKVDLDTDWSFGSDYDMVLSIDLINHLKNYDKHLFNIYKAGSHIVLEAEIADTDDKEFRMAIFEERKIASLSFNGEGSILSANNIEERLRQFGGQFKRLDDAKLNIGGYRYDWNIEDSGQRKSGNRRIWFIRHEKLLDRLFESNRAIKEHIHSHKPVPTYPDPKAERPSPAPPPPLPNPIVRASEQPPPRKSEAILTDQSNARVAVLISGHLRVFEKTYKRLRMNVIDGIKNCDVFIHTWETLGARRSRGREHDNNTNSIKTMDRLNEIMNAYNPKGLVIEKYAVQSQVRDHCNQANISDAEKRCFYGDDLFDYSNMLFSWQKVWRMMEEYENTNGIKYDVIFKYRSDILFPDKLNILTHKINARGIYIPIIAKYLNNGMNDQVAFGDRVGMGVYHNVYDRQIEYLNKRATKPMTPETLLKHHLAVNSVSVQHIKIHYYILRANGQLLVPKYDGFDVLPNQNQVIHLL